VVAQEKGKNLVGIGDAIDHALDLFRSDLQKAVTFIYEYLRDTLKIKTPSRYDMGAVLFAYQELRATGSISVFAGMNDPNGASLSQAISGTTGLTPDMVYNILFALKQGADSNNAPCGIILNTPSGASAGLSDTLQYKGVVGAASKGVSDVVNGALDAIGLPKWLIPVLFIAAVGVVVYFLVKKVKTL
jgi:hypothetical protein